MSEPILIALVQLFAIVAASIHKQSQKNTRSIIESYLKQYLNSIELKEYLLLYDELASFHDLDDEQAELNSQSTIDKILKICANINKSMQQKDKIIVFIKFVEFIEEVKKESNENYIAQEVDIEYYRVISKAFNLTHREYESVICFLLDPFSKELFDLNILIITESTNKVKEHFKVLQRERLDGDIIVLLLKSVNLFIGKYLGRDDLYLNGHHISKNQSFVFSPGGIIKGQKINPVYFTDITSELLYIDQKVKIQFSANDLGFTFKNSENGVQPFSFNAESGELIGVMGASGAGKSTLLNLLNGIIKPSQGELHINGYNLEADKEKLKRIIGFIPQDDLLIEELSVYQNLYFNAQLCYSNYSPFKLSRSILKMLNDVDLNEIRNLVVGDPLNKVISGGQRKRLNIALELIREPYVLFADEPTSGLSSMDSEMIMLLLKEQTLRGRLVMVNIHQPSSNIFKLFDKLLILDKGGFPIYYGNPMDSITYFKSLSKHVNPTESECLNCGYVNPEQLFQITEAKTINKHGKVTNSRRTLPSDWNSHFKKNIQPKLKPVVKKKPLPSNNFKIPNKIKQFKIFSIRNLFIKLSNKQYILINLLEAPFLALILAYLTRYSSDNNYIFGHNKNLVAYLFMSVVVALFLGMMVSAEEIIKDRKILKREAFLTLSRHSYLNSKILFLFVLSALQALLFIVVGNSILGINDMLFSYWLILFTTSCFANMIGLNLSSGLDSVVNIYILIPFILVPQLLLSGVIVPFDTLNRSISTGDKVPIVGDLMVSRWAFEALSVEQFTNNQYANYFYGYDKELSNYSYLKGYLIPAMHSILGECDRNISMEINKKQTTNYLAILKKETIKLEAKAGFNSSNIIELLTPAKFNKNARLETKNYLDSLSNYFSIQHKIIYSEREKTYSRIIDSIGKDGLLELKQSSYNASLADWVQNKSTNNKIELGNRGFVRKTDPIYMDPDSKIGRAQFYAPAKNIGSIRITTKWFNIGAIWLMTIVLYFTLLKDALRKSIYLFRSRSGANKAKK